MSRDTEIAAAKAALAEWEDWAASMATHCAHGETVAPAFAAALRHLRAAIDALDAVVAERDAYRRAKSENDERYMLERDKARAERDGLAAALATAHRHAGRGDGHATPMATADCIVSALVNARCDAHEAVAERDGLRALLAETRAAGAAEERGRIVADMQANALRNRGYGFDGNIAIAKTLETYARRYEKGDHAPVGTPHDGTVKGGTR